MMMFATYEHPTKKKYQAVKRGFSWPGLFLGPIWAFAKGLWLHGLVGLLIVILGGTAIDLLMDPEMPAQLTLVPGIAVGIIFGINGNKWRAKSLQRKGYQHKGQHSCG